MKAEIALHPMRKYSAKCSVRILERTRLTTSSHSCCKSAPAVGTLCMGVGGSRSNYRHPTAYGHARLYYQQLGVLQGLLRWSSWRACANSRQVSGRSCRGHTWYHGACNALQHPATSNSHKTTQSFQCPQNNRCTMAGFFTANKQMKTKTRRNETNEGNRNTESFTSKTLYLVSRNQAG